MKKVPGRNVFVSLKWYLVAVLAGVACLAMSTSSYAVQFDILDVGDSGTTNDGTIFMAEPNPTEPSTGTGVFEPFSRHKSQGAESGYNTDAQNHANNDELTGKWTRSVLFSELGVSNGYYALSLDANENGSATSRTNQILITNMIIYIGPGMDIPETCGDSDASDGNLCGNNAVWELDDGNGDVNVNLQASICDTNGQCGSGKGDLNVFIPEELLSGSPTDNFVLYVEYENANAGFEEWRFGTAAVPEPSATILLGMGLLGLGTLGRKRFRAKV